MSEDHKPMPWSLPFCLLPLSMAFLFWDMRQLEPLSLGSHPSCGYHPVVWVETHQPVALKLSPQCAKWLGPCSLRNLPTSHSLRSCSSFSCVSWPHLGFGPPWFWPLSEHWHFPLSPDSVPLLGITRLQSTQGRPDSSSHSQSLGPHG